MHLSSNTLLSGFHLNHWIATLYKNSIHRRDSNVKPPSIVYFFQWTHFRISSRDSFAKDTLYNIIKFISLAKNSKISNPSSKT